MGPPGAAGEDAAMDDIKLQAREDPAIRTFRICLERPPAPTIHGIVRQVAAERGTPGRAGRSSQPQRRAGLFA
jgi:hypothetical protein